MEELWKDMATLSHAHHHDPHPQTTTHQIPLYEFLASPVYTSQTQSSDDLNSCPRNVSCHNTTSLVPQGFATCPGSSHVTSLCLRKSCAGDESGGGSGCRRYKRKMKNRESATRSRARRQAYITELEIEVAQLREENALLRKKQEEISSAAGAASAEFLKKSTRTPTRSFTAPF